MKPLLIFLSFILPFSFSAQQIVLFAKGSAGIDRNYLSGGVRYYRSPNNFLSLEIGGGVLGQQSEQAANGSPNLSGQNGFESSISSGVVIARDGNAPADFYTSSLNTSFKGGFVRGGYTWRFSGSKADSSLRGWHLGCELAYFSIIQHQEVELHSYRTGDVYQYQGTAHAGALAPGLNAGYDFVVFKNYFVSPELACLIYIPAGRQAKSNGPFAKQTIEFRIALCRIFF